MSLTSINVNNTLVTSVDSEPTAGSDNLVKSGGAANKLAELEYKIDVKYAATNIGYIDENGSFISNDGCCTTDFVKVSVGDKLLYHGRYASGFFHAVWGYSDNIGSNPVPLISFSGEVQDTEFTIDNPSINFVRAWGYSNDGCYLNTVGLSYRIDAIENTVSNIGEEIGIVPYLNGYYYSTNNFVAVEFGDVVKLTALNNIYARIEFCDANRNVLKEAYHVWGAAEDDSITIQIDNIFYKYIKITGSGTGLFARDYSILYEVYSTPNINYKITNLEDKVSSLNDEVFDVTNTIIFDSTNGNSYRGGFYVQFDGTNFNGKKLVLTSSKAIMLSDIELNGSGSKQNFTVVSPTTAEMDCTYDGTINMVWVTTEDGTAPTLSLNIISKESKVKQLEDAIKAVDAKTYIDVDVPIFLERTGLSYESGFYVQFDGTNFNGKKLVLTSSKAIMLSDIELNGSGSKQNFTVVSPTTAEMDCTYDGTINMVWVKTIDETAPVLSFSKKENLDAIPYLNQKIKNIYKLYDIVVASDGSGDYSDLKQAMDYARTLESIDRRVTIFMKSGSYEMPTAFSCDSGNRNLSIIGCDKNSVVIWNDKGTYFGNGTADFRDNAPLKLSGNVTLRNLTIRSLCTNPDVVKDNYASYCIHIDFNANDGDVMEIDNCNMYNDHGACIGIGLRAGFTLRIKDCMLFSNTQGDSTWNGAVVCHDGSVSGNAQRIELIHNIIEANSNTCVSISNAYGNRMDALFIGNAIFGASSNPVYHSSTVDIDVKSCLNNITVQ